RGRCRRVLPRPRGNRMICRAECRPPFPSGVPSASGGRARLWWRSLSVVLLWTVGGLMAAPSTTQTLSLPAGWNLISIQVGDTAFSVGTFRSALSDPARLIEIWGYEPGADPSSPGTWRSYQPQLSAYPSDLDQMTPGRGYWVNVSQASTLTLTGSAWSG